MNPEVENRLAALRESFAESASALDVAADHISDSIAALNLRKTAREQRIPVGLLEILGGGQQDCRVLELSAKRLDYAAERISDAIVAECFRESAAKHRSALRQINAILACMSWPKGETRWIN